MVLCKVLGAIVVLVLAWLGPRLLDLKTSFEKELMSDTYMDNKKCRLLLGTDAKLKGSEDLALGKNGKVFIGAGDLKTTFEEGAANAVHGGVYIFDVNSSPPAEPVRLELKGLPTEEGTYFQVHGIFLSNASDRLYTVTHRGSFSSVEVFSVAYDSSPTGVSLQHIRSVRSSLFPNCGINDVVEGQGKGELYVSQWQRFPMPSTGKHHPQTILERLLAKADFWITFLAFRVTPVHHCVFSEENPSLAATCAQVTPRMFSGANGMATSQDRKTVFVNDPTTRTIHAMRPVLDADSERLPTATGKSLEEQYRIELPHVADNIEYNAVDGSFVMGTIPLPKQLVDRDKDPSVKVEGGIVVAHPPASGPKGKWTFTEHNHDASMLSQVSAAWKHGNRVILGSPFAQGALVCDL